MQTETAYIGASQMRVSWDYLIHVRMTLAGCMGKDGPQSAVTMMRQEIQR